LIIRQRIEDLVEAAEVRVKEQHTVSYWGYLQVKTMNYQANNRGLFGHRTYEQKSSKRFPTGATCKKKTRTIRRIIEDSVGASEVRVEEGETVAYWGYLQEEKRITLGIRLAFTQYCHYQYCMVYIIQTRVGGGAYLGQ